MKFSFVTLLSICILFSCSKKDAVIDPDPVDPVDPIVVKPDTLSAGWTIANSPSTEVFTDIFFADENNGYLSGYSNIYKSVNGGKDWNRIFTSASHFTHIGAANADRACFVANDEFAFTTINGIDVKGIRLNSSDVIRAQDCFYSSANTCFVSAERNMWKSTDGGTTFSKIFDFPDYSTFSSISFIDEMHGFVLRTPGLYKTSDGGISWTKSPTGFMEYGIVNFVNHNVGYYADQRNIYRTENGGTTWRLVIAFGESVRGGLVDIAPINETELYASCGSRVVKIKIGSPNQVENVIKMANSDIVEIHFTDANHGWACGTNGRIYIYKN